MLQRRQLLSLSLTAGIALTLVGCGFHLRGLGDDALGLDSLAIAGPGAESPFAEQLTERLEAQGTRVDANAPLRLNLSPEDSFVRRDGVLDSGSRDETLVLTIPYSIQRSSDSAYLVSRENLEATDYYIVEDGNLLSRDDLREDALDRARSNAVRQMIERLRALPQGGAVEPGSGAQPPVEPSPAESSSIDGENGTTVNTITTPGVSSTPLQTSGSEQSAGSVNE